MGGSTITAVTSLASFIALTLMGLFRVAGGGLPKAVALASAFIAAPIAVAAAAQAIRAMWRGPNVVSFARSEAVPCTASEAAFIREHSQLRGTMGGAGYLYTYRLVLPAVACTSAALVGAAAISSRIDDAVGPWPALLAIATALGALMAPARPYFYRDTMGGGAILSPPSAAYHLRRRAKLAEAAIRGEAPPAPTPAPPSGSQIAPASGRDPTA